MRVTQKQKLATYDAQARELEKLRLAVFDLAAGSRFPFRHAVRVNAGAEIDGNYPDYLYRISVSDRAMPYYMVENFGYDGKVASVAFWTLSEIEDKRDDQGIYWRVLRHALWKIQRRAHALDVA